MKILEIIFKLWINSCNSILMSRLQYQLNAPTISTDRNFLEEYQNLGITYLTGVVSVSGLFHFDPAWQVWNARCHSSRYKRQSTMSHQHLSFSCTHWKTVELQQVSKLFILYYVLHMICMYCIWHLNVILNFLTNEDLLHDFRKYVLD